MVALLVGAAASPGVAGAQAKPISYLPATNIEAFIVEKLDLSSFRNSLGPSRKPGMRLFSDWGLHPQTKANGIIEFREPDWYRQVTVLGRGDFNRDGLEDVAICFVDQSLQGTYRAVTPLPLTRYVANGFLIAISYEIDHASCSKSPRR